MRLYELRCHTGGFLFLVVSSRSCVGIDRYLKDVEMSTNKILREDLAEVLAHKVRLSDIFSFVVDESSSRRIGLLTKSRGEV